VNDIWRNYDVDNSGTLSYKETRKFVKEIVKSISGTDEINDEDFKAMFKKFDSDGNNTIEKPEMAKLIRELMRGTKKPTKGKKKKGTKKKASPASSPASRRISVMPAATRKSIVKPKSPDRGAAEKKEIEKMEAMQALIREKEERKHEPEVVHIVPRHSVVMSHAGTISIGDS